MSKLKILIVEDEPLISMDLTMIVENLGYEVSATAFNYEDAVNHLRGNKFDFAFLDINLGGPKDGIDVAKFINSNNKVPFTYITSFANSSIIARAKDTHPVGYIIKPFEEKEIYTALEIGLANYEHRFKLIDLNPEVIKKWSETNKHSLSEREIAILINLYEGKGNRQIAEENFISVNTVKAHLKNIFSKLGVHTRAEAVAELTTSI